MVLSLLNNFKFHGNMHRIIIIHRINLGFVLVGLHCYVEFRLLVGECILH